MAALSRLGRQVEEIIATLQAFVNDPRRTQDMEDIGALLRDAGFAPDSERDPYERLDDLMAVIEVLCRVWPHREPLRDESKFLL